MSKEDIMKENKNIKKEDKDRVNLVKEIDPDRRVDNTIAEGVVIQINDKEEEKGSENYKSNDSTLSTNIQITN